MNDDVILADVEPLRLGTPLAVWIEVKVQLAENNFCDWRRRRMAMRGRQNVPAIYERSAASVNGPVCTF